MFAKIFTQILDSSLADDTEIRHVFMDFLLLADLNGVVDMTPTAISARIRMPVESVIRAIKKLEETDPESRNPKDDGRRIVRLDNHRTWGWMIANYQHYREIASEEQRREKTLFRVHKYRQKTSKTRVKKDNSVTGALQIVTVTPRNACNAMQREREKQRDNEKNPPQARASLVSNALTQPEDIDAQHHLPQDPPPHPTNIVPPPHDKNGHAAPQNGRNGHDWRIGTEMEPEAPPRGDSAQHPLNQEYIDDPIFDPEPELLPPAAKPEPKKKARGTLEEFQAFTKTIGLPESDGETMYWKLVAADWKNGRNPVKDWQATMRQWKAGGYHPSQKNGQTPAPRKVSMGQHGPIKII